MEGESQSTSSEATSTPDAVTSSPTSTPAEGNTSQDSNQSVETNGHDTGTPPDGFNRVDFSPEQQARIDRLYGNMKRYEGDAKELREINQQLINTVQQLHQGQSQIVSHLQSSDFQEAESKLRSDRDTAWQKGDMNAYNTASDKLNDIKIQKNINQEKIKAQPVRQPVQPQNGRIVNPSLEQRPLSEAEANIARSWMSETDTTGNLKRSWTNANDPKNYAAALEGQAVFNSPQWADKPIADKLREIDRRMGTQTTQATGGQNVLPAGNLTRGSKPNNIGNVKLDSDIEKLAIKTKFGGPKAKTDQDHVDAWKRAVLKSNAKGAKR